MANKDLKNKVFSLPDELLTYLRNIFNRYSEHKDSNGYKRLKSILYNKMIGYGQMKRIKNYFDHYVGDEGDVEFILNGGNKMRDWIDSQLNDEREKINTEKELRRDNGELNQFRKAHSKTKKRVSRDYLLNKMISESEIEKIKRLINNIK